MGTCRIALFLWLCLGQAWQVRATRAETNPLQKVMQMLSSMRQDIIKQGELQHHAFVEFSSMCENRARELQHETKVASAQVEDITATIDKANDDASEADSVIEELSSSISTGENDLKAATNIRKKEAAEFAENQKDLIDTISQMERAISIIEKQLKGGASFSQMPNSVRRAQRDLQQERELFLTQALSAIVGASFISSADSSSLAELLQTSGGEEVTSGDAQLDAAADSYGSSQKGNNDASILDTLQGLLEKAQLSLEAARQKETKSTHNFLLFKGSLDRKLVVDNKHMADVKKEKAEAGQTRAEADGDLEVVKKNLAEDKKALSELHHECMTRASDYEDETKGRNEEQKAVAQAAKILKEMTGDGGKAFEQVSFVQTRSHMNSAVMSPSMQAAQMVRQVGQRQNLPTLVQMAHKMELVIRTSLVSRADPFAKVKEMISSMTSKLVKQMQEEATRKAYCDKEMGETTKHKSIKEGAAEKLSTKIDMQTSRSMELKSQVTELQKELSANLKTQQDVDRMRSAEHAIFEKAKPEIEQGMEGVRKALKVLRDYYQQGDDNSGGGGGGGAGVIGMLTVIESDFSKGLANLIAEEETAQSAYEAQTKENSKTKAIKEQDVVFKTKEAKGLDKSTSESSSDLDGVQSELDAIKEYFSKIQEECVAKPDAYEERVKRQELTLQGLQDALEILAGKAALLQGSSNMRGTLLRTEFAEPGGELN